MPLTRRNLIVLSILLLVLVPAGVLADSPIDRHALVSRHDINWNEPTGTVPLGNGEFAFSADGTGLQTFAGNTLSHWGWHSFPLPPGTTMSDVPATGTIERGRLSGPMRVAAAKPAVTAWMLENPHILSLGRLRLLRSDGTPITPADVTDLSRRLDLWRGIHTSRFTVDGESVSVTTCVHPSRDLVAVRVNSPLLRTGRLVIGVDFAYPSIRHHEPWVGDWSNPNAHTTEVSSRVGNRRADFRRTVDATTYSLSLAWSRGGRFGPWQERPAEPLSVVKAEYGSATRTVDVTSAVAAAVRGNRLVFPVDNRRFGDPAPGSSKRLRLTYTLAGVRHRTEVIEGDVLAIQPARMPHGYRIVPGGLDSLELVCAFAERPIAGDLPSVARTQLAVRRHWQRFWSTGGAIDLSGSSDPRWKELERRIVLSQYHTAAQSAGCWPPAEAGLMDTDPWRGAFHMEMVFWHLAHFALWDRLTLADKPLSCYWRFLPIARDLARQFDYKGAKWGKWCGPEGRTGPWAYSFLLSWQQPHPIFFAELEYRLRPTLATLEKWREIVCETAEYMADFPTRDDTTGIYSLQPIMPVSEQGVTRNTVYELAYWRWGLDTAQRWRERLGLPREPRWDDVRSHLAPLPVMDGLYLHSEEWTDTYTKRAWEHPNPVGVIGVLPPVEGVDPEVARRSLCEVWRRWEWKSTWGTDFAWTAAAAARLDETELAVDALLLDVPNNSFDARGVNTGGPCPYLPGNGGLLYVVAMMAAGWDGAPARNAPGFPNDGSWVVKWEGLKRAP